MGTHGCAPVQMFFADTVCGNEDKRQGKTVEASSRNAEYCWKSKAEIAKGHRGQNHKLLSAQVNIKNKKQPCHYEAK